MANHFLLLLIVIAALFICLGIYYVQYLSLFSKPKILARCQDSKELCKSKDNAVSCGVLELCEVQWQLGNVTDLMLMAYPPVDVKVYFESLCPDSVKFINEQLYPTFEKLYSKKIFTVALVAYGNVEEKIVDHKWVFTCQHGKEECLGNLIQTCAIHEFKDATRWMPFTNCMMKEGSTVNASKKCTDIVHGDYSAIQKCIDGPVGNELQHKMAQTTRALEPKHDFIPWITLNGKSEGLQSSALYKFMKLICDTYTGKRPEECRGK